MAREKKKPKRKRQTIPRDVYIFIENLERFLEVDVEQNEAQNNDYALSSHFGTQSSSHSSTLTNSASMIQGTTPNNPFMSFPAMELIEEGLDNVDAATLRQSIDPIWKSLESLDATAMLNLKQTDHGAQVTEGYVLILLLIY